MDPTAETKIYQKFLRMLTGILLIAVLVLGPVGHPYKSRIVAQRGIEF